MSEADLRADREWGELLLERVRQGCLADVDRMLSTGEGVNQFVDAQGDYALNIAARAGNAEMVRLLLRHEAYVDASGADARRPLHDAAKSGDVETVRALVDAGTSAFRTLDGQNKLASQYAAQSGSLAVLQLLAEYRGLVHFADSEDATPLSWAMLGRHYEAARFIAQQGGDTADTLMFLCDMNAAPERIEQVRFLLDELGADPEEDDGEGWRPAFAAATGKMVELLAILLDHPNTSQDTLNLTYAYLHRYGDPMLEQVALSRGADPRIADVHARLPKGWMRWTADELRRHLNAELMAFGIDAAMSSGEDFEAPATSRGFTL